MNAINGRLDVYLRNNFSSKALLEYTAAVQADKSQVLKSDRTNYFPLFLSGYETGNLFIKNEIKWSQRLAQKTALLITITQAYNRIHQNLIIAPSILHPSILSADEQRGNRTKQTIATDSRIFRAFTFGNFSTGLSGSLVKNDLNSQLESEMGQNRDFANNQDYL